MTSSRKKIIISLLAFFFILVLWFLIVCYRLAYTPLLSNQTTATIKVPPNSGIAALARRLQQRGLLHHPDIFIVLAELSGDAKQLKYGEYRIAPNMSATELLANIVAGTGVVKRTITFIEGWTFHDIKQVLLQDSNLRHKIEGKTNAQIMAMLGHPKQHPEGLFFPDTYAFTWGNTDLEVLAQAYQKMQQVLTKQWQQRQKGLPYRTAYQALIVASMIEKETALEHERPIIAGVMIRRLKKRMRLQVDPTVLYGLHKPYGSTITKRDLLSKTPYNTYQRYGLPPTPIDMPSLASIKAALHPAPGKALYYVARGDGSHVFSATYAQHLIAVKKYRREQETKNREEAKQKKRQPTTGQLWYPLVELLLHVI